MMMLLEGVFMMYRRMRQRMPKFGPSANRQEIPNAGHSGKRRQKLFRLPGVCRDLMSPL